MSTRIDRQSGLTVLDLAVAVLVMGALWQVTLQSQTMFDYLLAKRLATEMYQVENMVRLYHERYRAFPGDDYGAAARFPGAVSGAVSRPKDNGRIERPLDDDDWSGPTAPFTASEADEGKLFWNHVRHAGLARGDPADGFALNAVNGRLFVTSEDKRPTRPMGARGRHSVCSTRVDGAVAQMVDLAMDDGDATHGQVWAAREELRADIPNALQDVTFARAPAPYEKGHTYTMCKGF